MPGDDLVRKLVEKGRVPPRAAFREDPRGLVPGDRPEFAAPLAAERATPPMIACSRRSWFRWSTSACSSTNSCTSCASLRHGDRGRRGRAPGQGQAGRPRGLSENRANLEARLVGLGLVRRLSDSCSFVENPFVYPRERPYDRRPHRRARRRRHPPTPSSPTPAKATDGCPTRRRSSASTSSRPARSPRSSGRFSPIRTLLARRDQDSRVAGRRRGASGRSRHPSQRRGRPQRRNDPRRPCSPPTATSTTSPTPLATSRPSEPRSSVPTRTRGSRPPAM